MTVIASELKEIAQLCEAFTATCVINDHPHLASNILGVGAHVGQADMSPQLARTKLGANRLLGYTINTRRQLLHLSGGDVDYIGVGPVFETNSKAKPAPTLGLKELEKIVKVSPVPVIAIGGITPNRVAPVLNTGAHGIAILSGICGHPDPTEATRNFMESIRITDS